MTHLVAKNGNQKRNEKKEKKNGRERFTDLGKLNLSMMVRF